MEQIKLMTGWNFVGAMKGDVCILKAGLINPDNIRVDVTLEFNEGDVLLKTTAWKENFEQELVEQVIRKLKFPVTVEILEGSTMTLSHHEPLGVLDQRLYYSYGGCAGRNHLKIISTIKSCLFSINWECKQLFLGRDLSIKLLYNSIYYFRFPAS